MIHRSFNKKYFIHFLLFSFAFFLLVGTSQNTFAQGIVSSQYEVNGQEITYSQFIPLYGTFSVQIEYFIPLEIHSPELIHAGDTFDMLVTINSPGKIITKFFQDDNLLGVFDNELKIGEEKIIEIPESWVGQIFAMPNIHIQPAIKGPATMIPESILFDSETTKQFQVFVDEDILTFDSLQIELDATIKMKSGGSVNLGIVEIPLGEDTSDIKSKPIIKKIQLKKVIPVNLHLQVESGDGSEHIKVKASLTDSLQIPVSMSSHSVEIYVNGVPTIQVVPNTWSEDIFVGDGTHNFQARFAEVKDSNNIAIAYMSADSAVQTITVIPNQTSNILQSQCLPDKILQDGKCIMQEDPEFGGGCLIATAAYGSELAPQVQLLREIRDNIIMNTSSGTAFMSGFNQLYYSFSPTIADMERENPLFQYAVRTFITPMILTLSIMTLADNDSESNVMALGISIIALNLGMYIAAPTTVVGFAISKLLKSRK